MQEVTLMGCTIQNGPGHGILGIGEAAYAVKDTIMQEMVSVVSSLTTTLRPS